MNKKAKVNCSGVDVYIIVLKQMILGPDAPDLRAATIECPLGY